MITVIKNTPTASAELSLAIKKMIDPKRENIILAIGSDRATGDCLGPLVGHLLVGSGVKVYGDLKSPINALHEIGRVPCRERVYVLV